MKNILILTDFSDNATLAARYAFLLADKKGIENITFLHANQTVEAITNSPMVTVTFEDLHEDAVRMMTQWKAELFINITTTATTNFLVEHINLETGLNKICEDHNIDLVVMGISGKSGWEKVVIGSNAVRVLENCNKPLLIIPNSSKIKYPEKVLLATDLKDVKVKLESTILDDFLSSTNLTLDVINVSDGESDFVDLRHEIKDIFSLLEKYNPQFHYKTNSDVAEEINLFAIRNHSDIIVTIHKRRNWFSNLFRSSISKKLAWHSQVLLLVIAIE